MSLADLGIVQTLERLAVALANPTLSGESGLRAGETSELLTILATLAVEGDDSASDDIHAFREVIESVISLGRSPTPAQWGDLRKRVENVREWQVALAEETLDDDNVEEPEPLV
jgi:hypothetical protein